MFALHAEEEEVVEAVVGGFGNRLGRTCDNGGRTETGRRFVGGGRSCDIGSRVVRTYDS